MLEMCRARGILNATNALSSVMFNISYVSDGISITGLKQQFNNYKVTIPPMIEGLPVVRIANNAFRNQTTLTDIEIPSTVVSIGANAFEDCTALKSVTFEQDSNLTTVGNSAFDGCTNLLSIDIPNSVVSLGDNTFLNCTRLVGVSFESNSILQNIGNATFYNCTALAAIKIPASVTTIGANAFENCLLSIRCDFEAYSELTNMGNSAFANCDGLKSITLPADVTSIGYNAFLSCDALEYLSFNNQVNEIGANAFAECPKLTIYTTQYNIPSGWMNGWNSSNRPVLFYCGISYMNEEEEPYVSVVEKGDTNPMNANAENGISNPYRFGYDFGGWYLTDDFSGTKYDTISSAPNGDLYAKWILKESCVAQGTMITLADGTQKPVEQLTGNEMLLVWNMFTGTFDVAPILFIDSEAGALYEIVKLRFSDGSEVKVISEHGFWDVDLNKYVFLRKDAAKYIGHWFNKQITDETGNMEWTTVQLVAVDVYKEYTTAWSPVTYQHLCYYVNGMLSMPGAIEGLVNTFNVNPTTMKIDEESLNADLEQYGEFTYEEFVDIFPIPQAMFDAVNGKYLKVAIGKGYLTMQELSFLIDRYSLFFEIE